MRGKPTQGLCCQPSLTDQIRIHPNQLFSILFFFCNVLDRTTRQSAGWRSPAALLPAQEADSAPHPPLPRIIVHYHTAVRVWGDSGALMERWQGDPHCNKILLAFFFLTLFFTAPPGWIYTGYPETSEGSSLSRRRPTAEQSPDTQRCAWKEQARSHAHVGGVRTH